MNMSDIKKDYAVKVLKRIKKIQENYHKLKELGVDLIDYEDGVNLLEESIAVLFSKDDKTFENILNDVQWWLYEGVEKKITYNDRVILVTEPEDFIDWIQEHYK